jgi:hypothetical protein
VGGAARLTPVPTQFVGFVFRFRQPAALPGIGQAAAAVRQPVASLLKLIRERGSTMGLQERQKIKEYQDKIVPGRRKELAELTGADIAYDVDWDSFADDLTALNFFDNLAFHRINMAVRQLGGDQLVKDAIRGGLQTIRLRNVKDKSAMAISFSGGVLEMRCAYGLRLDGIYNEIAIHKVLVAGL